MDHDPGIGRLLRVLLEGERYRVLWRRNGADGLAEGVRSRPEAFILELDLPDADGMTVLRALREWSGAPVLILSVRAGTPDKVRALDAGANDYMVKPFAPEELVARLRVLLRCEPPVDDGPLLVSGGLTMDMATHRITVNGRPLRLAATEEAILHILARHAGKIVPCQRLVRSIWGTDSGSKIHELQVFVARLRRKLEVRGAENLIRGSGRLGYTLPLGHESDDAIPQPGLT
jgi:two-component system KDP operon response regulator KdpE